MDIIQKAKECISEELKTAKGCHDIDHTLRVSHMAMHLAEHEEKAGKKVDKEIVELSALLHDLARLKQDRNKGKVDHAALGAQMAEEFLIKNNYPKDKIKNILHCIKAHRFRNDDMPTTIEAKILFDADKLDSIGAIGIARAYHFSGEHGAKLHNKDADISKTEEYSEEDTAWREFMVKLRFVQERMLTDEGKRIAEQRHQFMMEFFDQLNQEVDGKR